MNVEQKLSINKFVVDEGNPHIVIHQEKMDAEAVKALTVVCPAGLYTLNDKGQLIFEVAGCLECGTCRVAVAHLPGAMEWNHPRPSFGVQYRCG
ncbi:MAG: ferredoxin family protein [Desulfovibrio sp.]|jgi:ferredoxin like protein|nr:ferredoxin family protein [Desulfovibrio sp.]